MDLEASLAKAIVEIWESRDKRKDSEITGFGVVVANKPRVTSPRFIVARKPKESMAYMNHTYGIDHTAYEAMRTGRTALLNAMMSESSWGAERLDPLRQSLAVLTHGERQAVSVAAMKLAKQRLDLGQRPVFVWLRNPATAASVLEIGRLLNDPELLEGWIPFHG